MFISWGRGVNSVEGQKVKGIHKASKNDQAIQRFHANWLAEETERVFKILHKRG